MAPILFTIGPYNVYAFGLFLAVSFIFSTFVVWKYAKEEFKEEEFLDTYFYTSLFALISARAVYILFNFDRFRFNILKYIVVRETPGLSLLGGIIGGFIFLILYARRKKYNLLRLLDIFSITLSVALFFSKIGEQLGGAGYGRETKLFFGVKIAGLAGRRFPVELLESFAFFLLAIILIFVYNKLRRKKWPEGLVFFLFVPLTAIIVFLVEFFKEQSLYLYNLDLQQLVAALVLIIAVLPLFFRIRRIRSLEEAEKNKI